MGWREVGLTAGVPSGLGANTPTPLGCDPPLQRPSLPHLHGPPPTPSFPAAQRPPRRRRRLHEGPGRLQGAGLGPAPPRIPKDKRRGARGGGRVSVATRAPGDTRSLGGDRGWTCRGSLRGGGRPPGRARGSRSPGRTRSCAARQGRCRPRG